MEIKVNDVCPICGGYGYTIEIEAECCGDFKDFGCCGVPNPIQVQAECKCDNGKIRTFQYNDGGRLEAGYKGTAGDCVCRAICIVTGKPYSDVYATLAEGNAIQRKGKHQSKKKAKTAAKGINTRRKWFKDYMYAIGFTWVPTMQIGQGCKVHLKSDELPTGRMVVAVSKHYVAVIDGVIHDTYDCSRGGTRCVYGYYLYNYNAL